MGAGGMVGGLMAFFASTPERCESVWVRAAAHCGVVVFRHVPKTGGTAVRFLVKDMATECGWVCPGRYMGLSVTHDVFSRAKPTPVAGFGELFGGALPVVNGTGRFPKFISESHNEWHGYELVQRDLDVVAATWPRCPVRVFAVIREPVAFTVSRWSYMRYYRKFPRFVDDYVARCMRPTASRIAHREQCALQIEYIFPELLKMQLRGLTAARAWAHVENLLRGIYTVLHFEDFHIGLALFAHRNGLPLVTLKGLTSRINGPGDKRVARSVVAAAKERALHELSRPGADAMLNATLQLDTQLHSHAAEELRRDLERLERQRSTGAAGHGSSLSEMLDRCFLPPSLGVEDLRLLLQAPAPTFPPEVEEHFESQRNATCSKAMPSCNAVGFPPVTARRAGLPRFSTLHPNMQKALLLGNKSYHLQSFVNKRNAIVDARVDLLRRCALSSGAKR